MESHLCSSRNSRWLLGNNAGMLREQRSLSHDEKSESVKAARSFSLQCLSHFCKRLQPFEKANPFLLGRVPLRGPQLLSRSDFLTGPRPFSCIYVFRSAGPGGGLMPRVCSGFIAPAVYSTYCMQVNIAAGCLPYVGRKELETTAGRCERCLHCPIDRTIYQLWCLRPENNSARKSG